MKVKNPAYVHPATQWARSNRASIETWFANRAEQEWIDFETLRTAAPALADYSDAELAEMLAELGLTVVQ